MNKQARFIELCNELHQLLKIKHEQHDIMDTFERHLDLEEKLGNNPIQLNKHKMAVARRLRNLMVHENIEGFHVAEPSDDIMNFLQGIIEQYRHIMSVKEYLGKRGHQKVWYIRDTDTLKKTLQTIHEKTFARFPVFNEKNELQGIVSTNGITKFMANYVTNGQSLESILNETMANVLTFDEHAVEYGVVSEKQSIFELSDQFEMKQSDGQKTEDLTRVVLVTNQLNGHIKHPEHLVGMVTLHDLPLIYDVIYDRF